MPPAVVSRVGCASLGMCALAPCKRLLFFFSSTLSGQDQVGTCAPFATKLPRCTDTQIDSASTRATRSEELVFTTRGAPHSPKTPIPEGEPCHTLLRTTAVVACRRSLPFVRSTAYCVPSLWFQDCRTVCFGFLL